MTVQYESKVATLAFPRLMDFDDEGKKSVVMFFDKKNPMAKELAKAISEAKKESFGSEKIKEFQNPLLDGNKKDLEKYPFLKDQYLMNCSSKFDVAVVNNKGKEIEDWEAVFTGCKCKVKVALKGYTHTKSGKKGVKAYLSAVMIGGGTRLIEQTGVKFDDSEGIDDLESLETRVGEVFNTEAEVDDILADI